ncbi:hypothetical protein M409DRAFT_55478 [Zasmidium cellare ATCC 36951]|uniref:Heme haloperoxidase family profile domain-containing protein n=1 Tax=Zasmidium cellare ATCC 36951 TaxID=1080233 RepID=A0A6A6CEN4_ZASCE|nr:uncharacterized protein M409DRAFT_55478 [Zasmidium cellare ATCC 36951]KAF2165575.1 hypothetical protein M409DRAFT_55478 [Zasmidium cellare ATCC 36951]
MRSALVSTLAAAASLASAQRPTNTSICDYYTTALLKENNATTQQTLLTLLVNTAVIGNYTMPNVGVMVPGILAPGMVNGTEVNLLPYFSGGLASTNAGGSSGKAVNFLDGGGVAPLMKNMPANDESSRQYKLLTHLYEYFAVLLGCSMYGSSSMPYSGDTNMYQVHKFMGLSEAEFTWFVMQVGLSAASFGVSDDDVQAAGSLLTKTFGYRCAPPAAIPSTAAPELQAICIASDCPESPMATCAAYAPVVEPMSATPSMMNATVSMPSGTGSMMPSSSVVPYTGGQSALVPALSTLLVSALALALAYL